MALTIKQMSHPPIKVEALSEVKLPDLEGPRVADENQGQI